MGFNWRDSAATAYANSNNLYIKIERIANSDWDNPFVSFRAAITQFADLVTANWKTEEVFGRMDPIATYQNTQRKISIGWDVIASDYDEAYENLQKVSDLQKFLYPLFKTNSATSMADAPLLRLRMSNLIQGTSGLSGQSLMGFVNGGFNFTPDIEMGFFHAADGDITFSGLEGATGRTKQMVPKKFSLSCDFTVLHEEKLGWRLAEPDPSNWETTKVYEWRGESTFPSLPFRESKVDREDWAKQEAELDAEWAAFDAQVQKDYEADIKAGIKPGGTLPPAVEERVENSTLNNLNPATSTADALRGGGTLT